MNKELAMIIQMTAGVGLYALGGWKWKWLRRELLPIVWGLVILSCGVTLWKVLLFILLQDGVFRLPYGEMTPYWQKSLVGCSYVIPSMLFGLTVWQLVVPVIFIAYFILSNWKKTAQEFSWKICEGTVGFQLGVVMARLACLV